MTPQALHLPGTALKKVPLTMKALYPHNVIVFVRE